MWKIVHFLGYNPVLWSIDCYEEFWIQKNKWWPDYGTTTHSRHYWQNISKLVKTMQRIKHWAHLHRPRSSAVKPNWESGAPAALCNGRHGDRHISNISLSASLIIIQNSIGRRVNVGCWSRRWTSGRSFGNVSEEHLFTLLHIRCISNFSAIQDRQQWHQKQLLVQNDDRDYYGITRISTVQESILALNK